MKLFLIRGEHEKLFRLLRKLRRGLLELPRSGGPDIHDGPSSEVQDEIDRIDRFFKWRKRMLKRSTVGEILKRWKPAPPVVVKAMRRAVEAFHPSSDSSKEVK
jgi:hypothetical protein